MAAVYVFICVREAYPSTLPIAAGTQVAFNRQAVNAIAGIRKSRHGIGDLLFRPIAKPIRDHLLCDGSAISRTSFNQLFAEIGTVWGEGDGATTFNLPNLLGDTPIAAEAPPQDVTDGGTVTSGDDGVTTGGRPKKIENGYDKIRATQPEL